MHVFANAQTSAIARFGAPRPAGNFSVMRNSRGAQLWTLTTDDAVFIYNADGSVTRADGSIASILAKLKYTTKLSVPLSSFALKTRVHAISYRNQSIVHIDATPEEADALLAEIGATDPEGFDNLDEFAVYSRYLNSFVRSLLGVKT